MSSQPKPSVLPRRRPLVLPSSRLHHPHPPPPPPARPRRRLHHKLHIPPQQRQKPHQPLSREIPQIPPQQPRHLRLIDPQQLRRRGLGQPPYAQRLPDPRPQFGLGAMRLRIGQPEIREDVVATDGLRTMGSTRTRPTGLLDHPLRHAPANPSNRIAPGCVFPTRPNPHSLTPRRTDAGP